MAYFKLSLLSLNCTPDKDNVHFIPSTISEFNSQIEARKQTIDSKTGVPTYHYESNFCYSYNEKLSIHTNGQKELKFTLDRMLLKGDEWIENPFARNILIGSQLLLEDKYGNQHLLTVSNIQYNFKKNNISYDITCQDSFSYQATRQNDGYEISNDPSAEDFIGAKTVDWWVENKIKPECHLAYNYVPMNSYLYEDINGAYHITSNVNENVGQVQIKRVVKAPIEGDEYYETIPFAGSGNAASVLISLGETNGLMINTFEHYANYVRDGQTIYNDIMVRYFWFEPQKNEQPSGITYSPFNTIQNFGLTHAGQTLTTVLNVDGNSFNDELVTLLPSITPFFSQYFGSVDWEKSVYSKGMYTAAAKQKILHYTSGSLENDFIIEHGDENYTKADAYTIKNKRYTGTSGYRNCYVSGNYLYLPITTGATQTVSSTPSVFYCTSLYDNITFQTDKTYSSIVIGKANKLITSRDHNMHLVYFSSNEDMVGTILTPDNKNLWAGKNIEQLYLRITLNSDDMGTNNTGGGTNNNNEIAGQTIEKEDIYINFNRIPTNEDLEFAELADEIPWLENKIIDFSYFRDRNILSAYDYNSLYNSIVNDLRIQNGKLLLYNQDYYNGLHQKTEWLSNLNNNLESIGASFYSDVITKYQNKGVVDNITQFTNTYNNIFNNANRNNKTAIIGYTDVFNDYLNKYVSAQQRFLKNIKNFRDYFNAPVSCLGDENSIYDYSIVLSDTITDKVIKNINDDDNNDDKKLVKRVYFTFKGGDYRKVTTSFSYYDTNPSSDTYGKPHIKLYNKIGGTYETLTIVDKSNYKEYLYVSFVGNEGKEKCKTDYNPTMTYYKPLFKFIDTTKEGEPYITTTTHEFDDKTYKQVQRNDEFYYEPEKYDDSIKVEGTDKNNRVKIEKVIYEVATKEDLILNYMKCSSSSFYYKAPIPFSSVNNLFEEIREYNDKEYGLLLLGIDYHRKRSDIENYVEGLKIDKLKMTSPKYSVEEKNGELLYYISTPDGITLNDYIMRTVNNKEKLSSPWSNVSSNYIDIPFLNPTNFANYYKHCDSNKTNISGTSKIFSKTTTGNNYELNSDVVLPNQKGDDFLGFIFSKITDKEKKALYAKHKTSVATRKNLDDISNEWTENSLNKGRFSPDTYINPLLYCGIEISDTRIETGYDYYTYNNKYINLKRKNKQDILQDFETMEFLHSFNTLYWQEKTKNKLFYESNNYIVCDAEDKVDPNSKYYYLPLITSEDDGAYNKDFDSEYNCKEMNFLFDEIDNNKILDMTKHYPFNSYLWELEPKGEDVKGMVGSNFSVTATSASSEYKYYIKTKPNTSSSTNSDEGKTTFGVVLKDTNNTYFKKYNWNDGTQLPTDIYDENHNLINWDGVKDLNKGFYYIDTQSLQTEEEQETQEFDINGHYFNKNTGSRVYTMEQIKKTENQKNISPFFLSSTTHTSTSFEGDKDYIKNVLVVQHTLPCLRVKNVFKGEGSGWELKEGETFKHGDNYTFYVRGITKNTNGKFYYLTLLNTDNEDKEPIPEEFTINGKSFTKVNDQYSYYSRGGETSSIIYHDFKIDDRTNTRIEVSDSSQSSRIETPIIYTTRTNDVQTISSMTNGEFWYKFNNSFQSPLMMEYASMIETQLQQYWSVAYNASHYCEYFLPQYWQPTIDGAENNFSSKIINATKEKVSLTNNIPVVATYNVNNNYNLPKLLLRYNISEEDIDDNVNYKKLTKEVNPIIYNIVSSLGINSNNIIVEETGEKTSYYSAVGGGIMHNNILKLLNIDHSYPFSDYSGLYIMLLKWLFNNVSEKPIKNYKEARKQHDTIWNTLYLKYPSILLEGKFNNSNATTSKELLRLAKNAFKDLSNPERNYNITIINNLIANSGGTYQGQELKIGDSIAVKSSDYYNEYDDVRSSLDQYLFITDVNYDLRKDTDISVTVNSIKYQDKLIQRLVKLIK